MKIKRVIRKLKNLWYWLPVIWNDQQWDHYYLYKVLAHKLRAMQRFFESDRAVAMNGKDMAEQIQVCADAAQRLWKDKYLSQALETHKVKWGYPDFVFNPISDELYEWHSMWYENASNYEENDLADREFGQACKRAELKRDKDRYVLFNTMRNKTEEWWD